MKVYLKTLLALAAVVTLLAGNLSVASAHRWGSWHWHKSGTQIVIRNYNTAANWQAAENARVDGWNKIGILYNYRVNAHTDVSVFDGYYGSTGWAGLASIESYSGSHILHAHARYNRSYPYSQGYIQGIFCQEIGHAWGLDHSATGDCMGLGYYSGSTYYYGSHNNSDFYNLYRNH